ncbi:MAG: hypothetical protein GKR86_15715, partial [Ilumatobacter sp.]|nr:hypothetical protein [Ilumatobacter sp.]
MREIQTIDHPTATIVTGAAGWLGTSLVTALAGEEIPVSIDTRRAAVMDEAIAAGATVVNDVSALQFDPAALDVVAASAASVILMHMQGAPETMQA